VKLPTLNAYSTQVGT